MTSRPTRKPIYVFHTLRYYTGEGTVRGLSSYRPLSEDDLGPEAMTPHILHNNRNLYCGKWVTEDLAGVTDLNDGFLMFSRNRHST